MTYEGPTERCSTPVDEVLAGINLRPGDRVGDRYVIREWIGEGGFAIVYRADQVEPVQREVAIKIIKLGMDTKQVIARFEAERQALALMDHVNVARVLDAGATDSGRPFFAMEYVPGDRITDYCDRHRLPNRDRMELFIQACSAVQHAHQKGIIHRDIKPSNVLVTVRSGTAQVKVIDFGVAKATARQLTEQTIYTEQGQLVGTPEYMSPEQAEMRALDIDTRTDVYSLGVLLYQLLTGVLPFDPKDLRAGGFAQIRRIIREQDPPKPSTKLIDLGDATTTIAARHHCDPRTLLRELRGDLDWITMRCLEKDRTRRYETADALAADVRRFLNDEPVLAGPPGAGYRLHKFVRRNRGAVSAAGAFVALLVLGIGGTSWGLLRAGAARDDAVVARDDAVTARDEAQAVSEFLQDLLSASSPLQAGRDARVVDVLEEAVERLERGDPLEPALEAAVRTSVGRTYAALELYDEADVHLRRALTLGLEAHGDHHVAVAETKLRLAWLLQAQDRLDEARAPLEESLRVQLDLRGELHDRTAETYQELGHLRHAKGDLDGAEADLRKALEIYDALGFDRHRDRAVAMTQLGDVLTSRGAFDEAVALHEQSLAIRSDLDGPDHPTIGSYHYNIAKSLRQAGRLDEAEAHAREAMRIFETAFPDTQWVAASSNELGNILRKREAYDGALLHLGNAMRIYELLPDCEVYVLDVRLTIATVLDESGRSLEAEPIFREVIEGLEATHGPAHVHTANAASLYGACLTRLERLDEAETELLAAYEALLDAGSQHRAQRTAERLTALYERWDRPQDAERWRSRTSADE